MGNWGALRVSGDVATFDAALAVAFRKVLLEKCKKNSPRYSVKFSDFPTEFSA